MNDNIWENLEKTPSIIQSEKRKLNANNLEIYICSHKLEEISKETFLDFFEKDSLTKPDPYTGYYLPHLLLSNLTGTNAIMEILKFAFDFVSPHQKTEKEGYTYLMCLFKQFKYLGTEKCKKVLTDAINQNVNFYSVDYEGNNFVHWALIRNCQLECINDLIPYLPSINIIYNKNNAGLNPLFISKILWQDYISKTKDGNLRWPQELKQAPKFQIYPDYIEIDYKGELIRVCKNEYTMALATLPRPVLDYLGEDLKRRTENSYRGDYWNAFEIASEEEFGTIGKKLTLDKKM